MTSKQPTDENTLQPYLLLERTGHIDQNQLHWVVRSSFDNYEHAVFDKHGYMHDDIDESDLMIIHALSPYIPGWYDNDTNDYEQIKSDITDIANKRIRSASPTFFYRNNENGDSVSCDIDGNIILVSGHVDHQPVTFTKDCEVGDDIMTLHNAYESFVDAIGRSDIGTEILQTLMHNEIVRSSMDSYYA